jgi:hypothetical protein
MLYAALQACRGCSPAHAVLSDPIRTRAGVRAIEANGLRPAVEALGTPSGCLKSRQPSACSWVSMSHGRRASSLARRCTPSCRTEWALHSGADLLPGRTVARDQFVVCGQELAPDRAPPVKGDEFRRGLLQMRRSHEGFSILAFWRFSLCRDFALTRSPNSGRSVRFGQGGSAHPTRPRQLRLRSTATTFKRRGIGTTNLTFTFRLDFGSFHVRLLPARGGPADPITDKTNYAKQASAPAPWSSMTGWSTARLACAPFAAGTDLGFYSFPTIRWRTSGRPAELLIHRPIPRAHRAPLFSVS